MEYNAFEILIQGRLQSSSFGNTARIQGLTEKKPNVKKIIYETVATHFKAVTHRMFRVQKNKDRAVRVSWIM